MEAVLAKSEKIDYEPLIRAAFEDMVRCIRFELSDADRELLELAYEVSVEAHRPQRRKSGEPYIFHPIAVARICAEEIGLGVPSVLAALLHDTIEDTEVTGADVERDFGVKVRRMVEGLTKLEHLFEVESPQAENFLKVLSTLGEDPRVALVKMADRMHNMRTIDAMKEASRLKIASETLYIYAPLAHRLGLYNIKTEFEDLCMRVLEPREFEAIEEELENTKTERDEFISTFIAPVKERLDAVPEICGRYRIFGRVKAISSIWSKVKKKKVDLKEIYDLFAVRVVLDVPMEQERAVCWQVYSLLTDLYMPIPDRLKDWTRQAKSNGYQSLHTTVVVPFELKNTPEAAKMRGRYVEVQIRSERMNDVAEKGLAAHWAYKGHTTERVFDSWLNTIRDVLENPADNTVDFLADFRSHLFAKEVYAFTPKGEMKLLPKGATALDFAFSIHTKVGYECKSARVNNALVPLNYEIQNGDQIEIIRAKNQKPAEGWLGFVKTSKARAEIRAALKEEVRLRAEYGKEILMRKLRAVKANFDDFNLDFLVEHLGFKNRIDFYFAIDKENINIQRELKRFAVEGGRLLEYKELIFDSAPLEIEERVSRKKMQHQPKLLINGDDASQFVYELASCCNPVQGESIFAYTTVQGVIKIHRVACPNAINIFANYGYRVMTAEWSERNDSSFSVWLKLIGIDASGIAQRITSMITEDLKLDLRSVNLDADRSGAMFIGKVNVVVANKDQMQYLIRSLKAIQGMNSVLRVDANGDELIGVN